MFIVTVTFVPSERPKTMDYECACGCGRRIPYQKRPREKIYSSDACRQRACRKRKKDRHDLARIMREADERFYLKLYQDIHRESWQDELELLRQQHAADEKEKARRDDFVSGILEDQALLREYITMLEKDLAEKEAEIVRLNMLLEGLKKKSRPRES